LALEKMEEYDRMMSELEVANIDFANEDGLLEKLGTPYKRQLQPLEPVDSHRNYSQNAEFQEIVE